MPSVLFKPFQLKYQDIRLLANRQDFGRQLRCLAECTKPKILFIEDFRLIEQVDAFLEGRNVVSFLLWRFLKDLQFLFVEEYYLQSKRFLT